VNQDNFYGEVEGDAFFERNFMGFDPSDVSQGHILRPNKASLYDFLIGQLTPSGLSVLEVGCAVGDLLYV